MRGGGVPGAWACCCTAHDHAQMRTPAWLLLSSHPVSHTSTSTSTSAFCCYFCCGLSYLVAEQRVRDTPNYSKNLRPVVMILALVIVVELFSFVFMTFDRLIYAFYGLEESKV